MILSIVVIVLLLIYIFYSDSLSVNDFKKHIEDKPVLLIGNSPKVPDDMGVTHRLWKIQCDKI